MRWPESDRDMFDNHPQLLAALTGFISGLVVCVPVGPVNLSIMNEGARRGFRFAMLITVGAVSMEVIYCALAFTGFAHFFDNRVVKAGMEVTSFVFMIWFGLRFVTARSLPTASRVEETLEERLRPHSAFMIGFVRVMGNPAGLLLWIVLAANFISREWVAATWPGKFACVGGVAIGAGAWFSALSWGASLGHGRFSEKTLLKIERASGVGLLALAVAHGVRIIWHLANGKM
jgi:threonine/homoserine/homoserine lactone efflux protein